MAAGKTANTNQNNLKGDVNTMATTRNATAATQQKEETMHLSIDREEFNGLLKTKMTTTLKLSSEINAIFKPALSDYVGCSITPDNFGVLQVSLFFKDNGPATDGAIKNIESATMFTDKNDMRARIRNANIRNKNRNYELTKDTKDILSDFISTRGQKQINWNQIVSEVTDQGYNGYSVYIKVSGIDLIKILKKKYGNKVEGSYVDYQVSLIRPISQFGNDMNGNFLVNVLQLDSKEVETLCKEIGMIPAQGNIPMIRA